MSLKSFWARDVVVGILAAGFLVTGSATALLPFTMTEVAGFVTGGTCVWLLVREHVWNWPVGIASCAIYFVVFIRARLFADGALQLAFIVLGFVGWWWWVHGPSERGARPIVRARIGELAWVAVATAVATIGLTAYLRGVQDTAPFLDALTTCLSLAATYLQARKAIESWAVWIAADLIYIPLYATKQLPLTSVLYVAFLLMCVKGALDWSATLRRQADFAPRLPSQLVAAE